MALSLPARSRAHGVHAWLPRQHGAWAMLAVPFLLGVAASRPDAWQVLLAVTAVLGYLASATAQAWLRARWRETLTAPLLVYSIAFGLSGAVMLIEFPFLAATLVILVPAAALVFIGARPGTPRDLTNSLAQSVQAVALAPAAAYVSGQFEIAAVAPATAIAAAYLLGTVLVVRSVLRERASVRFTGVSVGYHAAMTLVAAVAALPGAWPIVGTGLTLRAALLPFAARRRLASGRPLRPVHVGAVETVGATAVVLAGFWAGVRIP